ncbi:MAG: DUF2155 domain-containing protein [Desulfuromonadales bacterium]|nr:DUF2155 domain-containing protein [Desulfuromonadales bacterium]
MIAVSLQSVLFALPILFWGAPGGKKQDQQLPPRAESVHSHFIKKEASIVVPPSVAGKWKAVRIAVIDKSNVSQKVFTIPIGGKQAIPSTAMIIKVETFLPAFIMEGSVMTSSSNELRNPGVKVQISENGSVLFQGWLFSKFPNSYAFMHPKYGFTFVDVVPADK